MNRRRMLACPAIGLGVMIVSACGTSLDALPAPNTVHGATRHFSAEFTDVLDLTAGATVKLNGAVVGAVTSISENNFVARVEFKVQKKFTLSGGTTAQIRFSTPLGDDYVALTSANPSTVVLPNGANIPIAKTSAAPTIEDAFAALSLLLNEGGLDQIKTIADTIDQSLNGREGAVRSVLTKLRALVENLDRHKLDIDQALDAVHAAVAELNRGDGTIESALETFPTTLRVLSGDTGKLTDLLDRVAVLGKTVTGIVNQSQSGLISDLNSLEPSLNSLVANEGTLVPTVQSLILFGQKVAKALPGDYLLGDANITFLFGITKAVVPTPGQYPHNQGATTSEAQAVDRLIGGATS